MNSRDIQNLSEAYLGIYDDLNEANRWEKYRGLTPKERKDERNKNVPFRGDYSKKDPATAERRFKHQQQRGISPKKRLDDIRRDYNFNDSEYEKKSEEERVFHNEVPRMPAPRHGRRKPLGANTIKRMQPHLDFSRTRAKRRKELDTQNTISRENERKEMDKKSQNNWKTMMSIDDLQNRIRTKRAKNKIVPFHREELEYLISYLIDEGYASSFESAENIVNCMSELDEGKGWRDSRGRQFANNLPSQAVRKHLENSGRTRTPTPSNLGRRELKARQLETQAKNLETRDRTNSERRGDVYSSGRWKTIPREHIPSGTDSSSNITKLRDRAKTIRAVTRSQTRRTPDDVDNQRIANSITSRSFAYDDSRRSGKKPNPTNFDKATSHLDLTKIDPDSFGVKRKTTKKSTRPSSESNITKKDKKLIYKWNGSPRFSDRWESPSTPKNNIRKFKREDFEYLISYLLDEGYASDLYSAEVILENMSEGWKSDVLKATKKIAKKVGRSKLAKKANKFLTRTALGALGVPLIS